MKIVQINTFSNKSTGSIMMNIHRELLKQGHGSYVVWGRGRKPKDEHEIFMDDKFGVYYHGLYTRFTDKNGFASKHATRRLLKKLDEIKPDMIHLHNLHGYYINIELLFNYIKKNKIKVIWTLHDCWAFTGHCCHFEYVGCTKWKDGCKNCPLRNTYPKSMKDNSNWNYQKKKELFTDLDMTIVTPSCWLENLVKQSYLKNYDIKVIPNGIDQELWKPIKSDFRKKYHLEDKKIILGVTSTWTKEKGLYDFYELAEKLEDDTKIVLVGLSKKQLQELPTNILGFERTESIEELAKIYTASDIYFNPTYADNYPTTNLESLACKTPVMTYNTGGSIESASGPNLYVVELKELKENYNKYLNVKYKNQEIRNTNQMIQDYIKIYGGE